MPGPPQESAPIAAYFLGDFWQTDADITRWDFFSKLQHTCIIYNIIQYTPFITFQPSNSSKSSKQLVRKFRAQGHQQTSKSATHIQESDLMSSVQAFMDEFWHNKQASRELKWRTYPANLLGNHLGIFEKDVFGLPSALLSHPTSHPAIPSPTLTTMLLQKASFYKCRMGRLATALWLHCMFWIPHPAKFCTMEQGSCADYTVTNLGTVLSFFRCINTNNNHCASPSVWVGYSEVLRSKVSTPFPGKKLGKWTDQSTWSGETSGLPIWSTFSPHTNHTNRKKAKLQVFTSLGKGRVRITPIAQWIAMCALAKVCFLWFFDFACPKWRAIGWVCSH